MTETSHKTIKARWIFVLTIPASLIYLSQILIPGRTLASVAIGYVLVAFSFGIIQSIFNVKRPYVVAFFSSAVIPALIILFVTFATALIFLLPDGPVYRPVTPEELPTEGASTTPPPTPILCDEIPDNGLPDCWRVYSPDQPLERVKPIEIPLTPSVYIRYLGMGLGLLVFAVVASLITIPFGIIGIAGRFTGDELIPSLITIFTRKEIYSHKENGMILFNPPESEAVSIAKIKNYAVIASAIISAVVAILVSLIK